MKQIRFRLTAYTDPAGKWDDGAPNKGNEDNLFVDTNLSGEVQGEFLSDSEVNLSKYGTIMVVADGMGGTNAGEVASAIAIGVVKRYFGKDALTPDIVATSASRERYMERVVTEADAAIKSEGARNKECEGMGSTIILAWLCGGELSVTWCGDSRVYLFREPDGLHQVSKDHSYVQSLVDSGQITEEEAFDHPYGNVITRSLGDPERKAQSDSLTIPVYKGDIILVCSDGLSGVLRDRKSFDRGGAPYPGENMEDIIRANRSSMVGCREALWKAAESAGWYDNVTAILCEITAGDAYVPPVKRPGSGEESLSNTLVSFSIHKKTLRRLIWVLIILLIILGLFFLCKHHPEAIHSILPSSDTTSVSNDNAVDGGKCGCANCESGACDCCLKEEVECVEGCTCGDECACKGGSSCGEECGEGAGCKCSNGCECSDDTRCGGECSCETISKDEETNGSHEVNSSKDKEGKGKGREESQKSSSTKGSNETDDTDIDASGGNQGIDIEGMFKFPIDGLNPSTISGDRNHTKEDLTPAGGDEDGVGAGLTPADGEENDGGFTEINTDESPTDGLTPAKEEGSVDESMEGWGDEVDDDEI